MGRRKEVISAYLEPEQLRDLRSLSSQTRLPVAVLLRDAVEAYLGDRRSELTSVSDDRQLEPL